LRTNRNLKLIESRFGLSHHQRDSAQMDMSEFFDFVMLLDDAAHSPGQRTQMPCYMDICLTEWPTGAAIRDMEHEDCCWLSLVLSFFLALSSSAVTRHYYLAAEDVAWDYAPSG